MKKASLGRNFTVEIGKLIDTRLLVQANSGGGKSYAIRKLIEETHGHVQQIILDIEGDFASLRTNFDFILAGKGGDIPADPKSADLMARKILEHNSDIIIDLYELKQPDRIAFVKNFLESMINAPKTLWHPVLVILDEAHIFAPEKGHAQSLGAVIDMATRGRKRGYCIVLATQRLSKLRKDAAAECNNKMIGRTGLDIDLKRAGDELGLKNPDVLRTLSPGEFYVYGPAFESGVNVQKIGTVVTRHPEAGKRGFKHVPAPRKKVKEMLKKLSDIPKEAEVEIKDKAQLQASVRELEASLKKAPVATFKNGGITKQELDRMVSQAKRQLEKELSDTLKNLRAGVISAFNSIPKTLPLHDKITLSVKTRPIPLPIVTAKHIKGEEQNLQNLGACERKILGFLKLDTKRDFTKVQVGALTGYAHTSGGFNNALSKLFQMGLIHRGNGRLQISIEGEKAIEGYPDGQYTLADWLNKLGACERKIYAHLLETREHTTKEIIAEVTGYSAGSGGFNNALSRLSTLGLIERSSFGIKVNSELEQL